MTTQTMAEMSKHIADDITRGVAEDIITVNQLYNVLPFVAYSGDGVITNRENVLGDVQMLGIGDNITAKAAASYGQSTFTATKIIGDAHMDGLVQAQSDAGGVDAAALEISSKAKSVAEQFMDQITNGSGTGNDMNSLHTLVDASMYTPASAGQALSFDLLDELLDLIKGGADFIVMSRRTRRAYKALLRSAGGNTADDMVTLQNGEQVLGYNGIPVFVNDNQSVTETANGAALTGGALTSVYAGKFDDGSRKRGLAAIYPKSVPGGVQVEPIGAAEGKDESIWRVKQYTNLALFNRRSLARLTSINN